MGEVGSGLDAKSPGEIKLKDKLIDDSLTVLTLDITKNQTHAITIVSTAKFALNQD